MSMQALEPRRAQTHRRRDGSEPNNLFDASLPEHGFYVAKLTHAERRLDEAQKLYAKHEYDAARLKLTPHLAKLPKAFAGAVYLLLGQCAMRGAGRNWPALLYKALAAYQAAGDVLGGAQVRLLQGCGLFARGELNQAQTQLTAARRTFFELRVAWGEAMACGAQAQLYLAQHDLDRAMDAADTSVRLWAELNEASEEATIRQVRAQLWASAGRQQDAARDLLWAERLVSADASRDVRLQLALSRADSLLWMGYSHRAAAALGRIAESAQAHADICVQAHFHRSMGQAFMVDAPALGAQHLYTAIELLQQLGQSYYLALAHINLACCEHRLGMSADGRLQTARLLGAASWPVVRDALEGIERRLQAPPGRMTGPQPAKHFDVDLESLPSHGSVAHGAAEPQGRQNAQPDAISSSRFKLWTPLWARLQTAWRRFGQRRGAERKAMDSAPGQILPAQDHAAAEHATADLRPVYSQPPERQLAHVQAEITRV